MPGQPVKIGPFVGGMNTYSGPSAISDNEASELLNLDVDLDGSLSSRAGIQEFDTPFNGLSKIIGIYRSTTDQVFMIYAFALSVWAADTSVSPPTFTKIADGEFTTSVQYNDKLWLVKKPAGSAVGGGKWDILAGYTAVATMPRGYSACIYKERMFIAGSKNNDETSLNRIKFCNPANPDAWTSTDTFDVSAGDGQDIMKLHVYDASIVIFKTDSTYVYAYESSPSKGQVQIVSSTIGANNRFSVEEYENSLFVFHEDRVYRISNWNWELANIKIPFLYNDIYGAFPENTTSLSVVGNRIIARYYDRYYVLGMKTGAWSIWEWQSGRTPGHFVRNPNIDATIGTSRYYAGTYRNVQTGYTYKDNIIAEASTETFPIRLVTKAYDFGPSYGFKRLFWWGADQLTKTLTTYRVSPVIYAVPVTWGELIGRPFSTLGTWGRPFEKSIDVTDSMNSSNPTNYRTFVKLLKSLRFRQVTFTVEATVDGTLSTGPCRIFSLTAFVDSKEIASKKVS